MPTGGSTCRGRRQVGQPVTSLRDGAARVHQWASRQPLQRWPLLRPPTLNCWQVLPWGLINFSGGGGRGGRDGDWGMGITDRRPRPRQL